MAYPKFSSKPLILNPAKTTPKKPRPYIILKGGERVNWSTVPNDAVVLSMVPLEQIVKEHHGNGVWFEMITKRRKPQAVFGLKVVGRNLKIRRGPSKPTNVSVDEYEMGFDRVSEYLANYGVSYSSSSNAADTIFRQGLETPVRLTSPIGRAITKGSRGICYPGSYSGPFRQYDIRSAYPSAMFEHDGMLPKGALPILDPKQWHKHKGALVFARVITLDVQPNKSPILLEQPLVNQEWHSLNSIVVDSREVFDWFFDFELRTIEERNHYIEPIYAFKLLWFDATKPLERFNEILGRRYDSDFLGSWERKLLKGVANSFWGSLVTGQIVGRLLNENGKPAKKSARSVYQGRNGGEVLSAWISAKVSDKAFREFIEPHNPIYFDTDGGYVLAHEPIQTGQNVGEWVEQDFASSLEIIGWQAYAAHSPFRKLPKVVLSGVPNDTVSYSTFRRLATSKERSDRVKAIHPKEAVEQVWLVHKTEPRIMFNLPVRIDPGKDWLRIIPKLSPDSAVVTPKAKKLGEFEAWIDDETASKLRALATVQLNPAPN